MTKLEEMTRAYINRCWAAPGEDYWANPKLPRNFHMLCMAEALKVLREPSEAMLDAAGMEGEEDWRAMIDVVLAEAPK